MLGEFITRQRTPKSTFLPEIRTFEQTQNYFFSDQIQTMVKKESSSTQSLQFYMQFTVYRVNRHIYTNGNKIIHFACPCYKNDRQNLGKIDVK